LIIAIVLHPVVNFIVRIKINRVIAILITLLITVLIIFAFSSLIISQVSRFSETLPLLIDKFTGMLDQAISWASGYFDIKPNKIHEWITKTEGDLINTSSAAIGQTLVILGNGLVVLFLLPVYIFLILFYHPILIEFIHRLFGSVNESKVSEIVAQIKNVIQRYLIGLVIEAGIMATLNTSVLLLLGIQYAILLGIIAAVVNVIPYIGGLVGVALPMMVALATKQSGWYAIYVMVLFYIIQLIDNNYIVPKIVASKVKINALFSIIVVFIGNALWGIPGMFLSIPLLAIVKLICDHIEPLKPWGFLLGDNMPSILKIKTVFKKTKL
jgi:predicted PurR-regulated permease PerM